MNKQDFLKVLASRIQILPAAEQVKSLEYYEEMIQDGMEAGKSEEEAVEALGSIEDITQEILINAPIASLVKSRTFAKKRSKGEIALLILGAPLWLPLLLSAAAIVLSVYLLVWTLAAVLFAIVLSFGASALITMAGAVFNLTHGRMLQAVFLIGASSLLVGLAFLTFVLSRIFALWLVRITIRCMRKIKASMIRKGEKACANGSII